MLLLIAPIALKAQESAPFGSSDPSPKLECGEYQWPEVQSACPEVQIKQKHDHTSKPVYRKEGWDTAVTCKQHSIVLSCMPFIPTQYFNGQYTVDTIPYDPPDTTFYLNGNGIKMDITSDDAFAPSSVSLEYPFYFFGIKKEQFRIGDNGVVTFCTNSSYLLDVNSNYCPYSFSAGLPWTANTTGSPGYFNRMHDAIYGVYQDTHVLPSTVSGNQGIYYGVLDSFPCRKIIASWNEIPLYNSQIDKRCTYQIVCYEGSNIIEVHIKHRTVKTGTNDGLGLIGIQNATGNKQVKGSSGTTTYMVTNNSPAAFYPKGRNGYKTAEDYVAYRFTPQGVTNFLPKWYRIFEDGQDSIDLTTNPNDTNGYYVPMDVTSTCPTLTTAVVSPKVPSRYVFHLKFKNANNDWYNLVDTIVVGVDTSDATHIYANGHPQDTVLNICQGQSAELTFEIPELQVPLNTIYRVTRESMGNRIELDTASSLTVGNLVAFAGSKRQSVTLSDTLPTTGVMANKIDSVYVQVSVEYESGCTNYDEILVRIFPNFDTTEAPIICKGDPFTWSADGQSYASSTQKTVTLKSIPGCDSVVHIDLTVLDVSHSVDYVEDCKPYTWLNGITYESSNNSSYSSDTIVLQNQWGCDSIVQLDLTITPVVARIQSNRQSFNFDNLDVELNDISTGSNSRTWHFPGGGTSNSSTAHFTMPTDRDSARISLVAYSPYGCLDSTHIVIPLRKETFWVPNTFTPGRQDANSVFSSVSHKTLTQEMRIYNRYGSLVFECDGVDCPWDGRNLNGDPCPQGTYVYIIRYTNEFEPLRTHVVKGTVTLVR